MRKLLFLLALFPGVAFAEKPNITLADIDKAETLSRTICPRAVSLLAKGDEQGAKDAIDKLRTTIPVKYVLTLLCASYLDGFSARHG
jgi:hypothetical protein